MYATMSGWWTVSTVAKSRALNASSPFFISVRRCAVRLVPSVGVVMMAPSCWSAALGCGEVPPRYECNLESALSFYLSQSLLGWAHDRPRLARTQEGPH